MLVPEQAALQMERGLLGLLETHSVKTLGRCEVLSFRRLANRIFKEATGPTPLPLSAIGRQMALRLLISRHRGSLREFARVADRATFIREISLGIAELLQEAMAPDRLDDAARAAEDTGDPTASRLHDVALLYRAYLEYLGDTRVDPEGVLDLARARLPSLPWLRGARILVDGFAGLTQQQIRMLADLASIGSTMHIALLIDQNPPRTWWAEAEGTSNDKSRAESQADAPGLSLFARTRQTCASLIRAFQERGVTIEVPIHLNPPTPPRFKKAPDLAALEKNIFAAPPVISVEDYLEQPGQSGASVNRAVRIARASSRRNEVDAAVRNILDLVQRETQPYRLRDIAIIVRDLAPYHDILTASLHAHGLPFFIDRRRPTHHHPLIQLVRGLLMLTGAGRFDEAVVRILKSGLSGFTDTACDAVENYALAFQFAHAASWDRRWTRPIPDERTGNPPGETTIIAEQTRHNLRERLADLWPTSPSNHDTAPGSTWVRRLYDALKKLNVAASLNEWRRLAQSRGELDEAAEHEQVWNELIKLLEELDGGLGDEPMTARQFREVVESGVSEFTLGLVPPTLDQLLVGSIERSRHPPIKAAFLLGFCEGDFPARINEETIFGDAERAFLAAADAPLGRSREDQQLDERALAYIAVTRASEFLWISYPGADSAGRALEPSPFLPAILGAVHDLRIETHETDGLEAVSTPSQLAAMTVRSLRQIAGAKLTPEAAAPWLAAYDWARTSSQSRTRSALTTALRSLAPIDEATLDPAVRKMLWPAPYSTSITRLESLAGCAYRHFVQYGLRLTERARGDVSPLHLGNLYHDILEQFVNAIIESGDDFATMTDDDIAAKVDALCETRLDAYAERLGLSETQRRKTLWRARRELPFALRAQRDGLFRTSLRPHMTEQRFGDGQRNSLPALVLRIADDREVKITGKIDRVDFVQSGPTSLAVVFDYKRSIGKRLKLHEVYHGVALQLIAYLLVLRDAGEKSGSPYIVPGGAFFMPLLTRPTRVDHPTEADANDFSPFDGLRPRGVIDFDWIDALQADPESGAASPFAVERRQDGEISRLDHSDAVPKGVMLPLLDHVRTQLTQLAERWLDGDIRVRPTRIGHELPCPTCVLRSICRFEHATHKTRDLPVLSRTAVVQHLVPPPRNAGDAPSPEVPHE